MLRARGMLESSVVGPVAAASAVALRHASDDNPGITRRKRGKTFYYLDGDGARVRDPDTLSRIRALAVPPAWTQVWISPDPDGHNQATGRDARGRKPCRYHAKWRVVRDEAKYYRLVAFCRALPALREAVETDLACSCLCKRKVLATVVALMERAQLRVGNDEYTRANGSYGATTRRDRHAALLLGTLEHPGSVRGCTRSVTEVLVAVASRLGHTPAVCRTSYIHPRVIEEFTSNRLAPTLARQIRRRIGSEPVTVCPDAISVDVLRAIEPVVASYLDETRRRRHA